MQDGEEHPITYISRKLLPREQKYATIEKECLAIKWALEQLKYYLLGRHFTLVTDHAPLVWMSRHKETNARITRWFLSLQPYAFSVVHRSGAAHGNADALSRMDALGTWTAPPSGSELKGGVCGSPRGRNRGVMVEGRYVSFGALFPVPRSGAPPARQAEVAVNGRRSAPVRERRGPGALNWRSSSEPFIRKGKTAMRWSNPW